LITGYAREGLYEEALNAFEQMQKEGFLPNDITLLCVLNACCRAGKPDKAQMYYEDMSKKYSITPKLEHHTCMVAAFGSVGHFDSAISLIKTISCSDHPSVWLVLLDSCRRWGNVKLARFSFDQVIQLGGDLSGSCVLMASIYAEMGMHEEAVKIEAISIRVKMSSRSQGVPCDSMMSPENSCVAQSPVDAHTDQCKNFLNNHEQIFHFKDYG
jgi:pentatricopeptide repeat protein